VGCGVLACCAWRFTPTALLVVFIKLIIEIPNNANAHAGSSWIKVTFILHGLQVFKSSWFLGITSSTVTLVADAIGTERITFVASCLLNLIAAVATFLRALR